MAVYYRDDTVRVTSSLVQAYGLTYPLSDLSYVWHRRMRPDLRVGGRIAGRWALVTLLAAPFVLGGLWLLTGGGTGVGIGLITLAAILVGLFTLTPLSEFPLMALERSYDRGSAVHEIWVQCRGMDVLLLRTNDALRFGQIYRALQRALEQSE
ncbi:DUF6232 family protein [Phytohabitans kaempferiae]|uniref:DUF6232 family protein n=1 Tax=Phytohabitans kaempferiae TaxID=1620943 RepID=A0ABV6M5T3_9ACTN